MPLESNVTETECNSKSSGSTLWLALLAAVGLTATAIVVAKRYRASSVRAHVHDLVGFCDEAAKALDERLGHADSAYATS